jgi:hypothetical protein
MAARATILCEFAIACKGFWEVGRALVESANVGTDQGCWKHLVCTSRGCVAYATGACRVPPPRFAANCFHLTAIDMESFGRARQAVDRYVSERGGTSTRALPRLHPELDAKSFAS